MQSGNGIDDPKSLLLVPPLSLLPSCSLQKLSGGAKLRAHSSHPRMNWMRLNQATPFQIRIESALCKASCGAKLSPALSTRLQDRTSPYLTLLFLSFPCWHSKRARPASDHSRSHYRTISSPYLIYIHIYIYSSIPAHHSPLPPPLPLSSSKCTPGCR